MADPVYVEMELRGTAEAAVAFIEGVRVACGDSAPVWFASRERIEHDSLMDAIREKMRLEAHVIMDREHAERIAAALDATDLVPLHVEWMRDIDYAELSFDFRCFSRDDAHRLRRLLENDLPEGVRLEDYEVDEQVDEGAKGVELYSPAHEYVCSGSGRYVGQVPGIFAMSARLDDQEFVHPGKVRLHHPS